MSQALGGASVGEADGTTRATLQCEMHRSCVMNEIHSGPRISREEFRGQEITLQAITPAASGDEIAWSVNAALGERKDMIDGRYVVVERRGAIDAPPTAVTHHGVLNRALLVATRRALCALGAARGSR